MIRAILYSLVIMLFLGFLLGVGLLGPEQGRKITQRILEFVHWKPAKKYDGMVSETQNAVAQFNDAHKNIQLIRQMTLERSTKSFQELDGVYQEARAQLKQLLSGMQELTAVERKELLDKFSAIHARRAALVEEIISSQQVLININEQMDQQLRAMAQWFRDKTTQSGTPGESDVFRMQQFENLKSSLKAFNEETSHLDAVRILYMKKNKETVERLAGVNMELEARFRQLIAQVDNATPAEGAQLWDEYQVLETRQREMVAALNANEEFISDSQAKMLASVGSLSQSIQYSSDNQLKRFRDSFEMMNQQRRELMLSMRQRQEDFLSSRPSMSQLMEDNKYRMQILREQASSIADQYERMEEFRKSTAAAIQSMNQELKDQAQFASRQTDDVMERGRMQMDGFIRQMQTTHDSMESFIQNSKKSPLEHRPAMEQIVNLQEKMRTLKANVKQSEEQMRSVILQLQKNQKSLSYRTEDAQKNYSEKLLSIKERTEDQKRIFSERVEDQMKNLKDRQESQSGN